MKFNRVAIASAEKIVAELDARSISVYITLAKAALWVVAAILGFILLLAMSRVLRPDESRDIGRWYFDTGSASVVVQSAQALAMLAVTVLGFHSYKGSRVFHVLRNWNKGEPP